MIGLKGIVSGGIGGLLVGAAVGYFLWGPWTATLTRDLTEVKARLAAQTVQLVQSKERRRQVESQINQLQHDLKLERERREKLELLISRGRK